MAGPLQRSVRGICLSLAVAALTALTVFVFSYLLFPVRGVQVEGARMFPESEAWDTVPDRASLLTLNTKTVERGVASNPWVKSARVTKDWRSGIVLVQVEERRAVLDGEIGGRRVILAADGTELPGLGGADLDRVELDADHVEEILKVAKTLEEQGLSLRSVDGVGAGGVEATVGDRKVVFSERIGDGQARALSAIMERNPEASLFDLRSPGRVVVSADRDPVGGSSG